MDPILTADAGLPPTLRNRIAAAIVALATNVYPPSSTDPRILMSDVGFPNGLIDFDKYVNYGPPKFKGTVIRSGQGLASNYDDVRFKENVAKSEARNHPWMAYHVLMPAQSAEGQVRHLMDLLEGLGGPLPRWIWWDVQVSQNQTKRAISNAAFLCVEQTTSLSHIGSGIYSAKWFTDGYMETQDWFSEIAWWIAQWLLANAEAPTVTMLPAGVNLSQVMIHQTGSRGDGKLVGMQSASLDLDRWMWSPEKFQEIMHPEEPPGPTPIEKLDAGLMGLIADANAFAAKAEELRSIIPNL